MNRGREEGRERGREGQNSHQLFTPNMGGPQL